MAKGNKKRIRPTLSRPSVVKRRIRPTFVRKNMPGEAAILLGKNLRESKKGGNRFRGGQEKKKKRISPTLVSSPAPSKASLSNKTIPGIVKHMGKMLSRYNVDDTAFERTTAALEKKLRENDKIRDKREEALEEALDEAQKRVDSTNKKAKVKAKSSKSKSKGKSASQTYLNSSRDCGAKKVVRVRGYTRCGVK